MANSGFSSEPSMMVVVNRVIDDLHGSLGLPDSDFFCECGRIDCKERITLTRAEYAHLLNDDRPVLVGDHAYRRVSVVPRPPELGGDPRASSGDPHGR